MVNVISGLEVLIAPKVTNPKEVTGEEIVKEIVGITLPSALIWSSDRIMIGIRPLSPKLPDISTV